MLAQHIKAYKTTATGTGTALPWPAKTSVKMANNADTDQTLLRDGLMCVTGEEKIMARPGLESRASCLRCEHFAN